MVECEDKVVGKMYPKVAFHYFKAILEVSMHNDMCKKKKKRKKLFP
jgi:hypothetical protein